MANKNFPENIRKANSSEQTLGQQPLHQPPSHLESHIILHCMQETKQAWHSLHMWFRCVCDNRCSVRACVCVSVFMCVCVCVCVCECVYVCETTPCTRAHNQVTQVTLTAECADQDFCLF